MTPKRGKRRYRSVYAGLLAALAAWSGAAALECEHVEAEGAVYTVCRADPAQDQLRLFLDDARGRPLRRFAALEKHVMARGERLVFAMNAGMFHRNRDPVGLLVADGVEIAPLELSDGVGNFYLKPNGVFLVGEDGARIVESSTLAESRAGVRLATQSGPLLVSGGALHHRLDPQSTSRYIRNGVGVDEQGLVVFAISHEPRTLHETAVFFRDVLGCPDALYLDGAVSSIYAPALGESVERADRGMGPIIAVVETLTETSQENLQAQ